MSVACTPVRTLRGATVVLALVTLASSCSLGNSAESTSASMDSAQRTESSTAQKSLPPSSEQQPLSWTNCADDLAAAAGLECATLQVPIDPASPSGPTTELALIRQPSTGSASERIGSLVCAVSSASATKCSVEPRRLFGRWLGPLHNADPCSSAAPW